MALGTYLPGVTEAWAGGLALLHLLSKFPSKHDLLVGPECSARQLLDATLHHACQSMRCLFHPAGWHHTLHDKEVFL